MKTSQDVLESGLYSSECCGSEKTFEEHNVFERCPNCMSLCSWEFVEEVTSREHPKLQVA